MEYIILYIIILTTVMYYIIETAVKNGVKKPLNEVKEEIVNEFNLKQLLEESHGDENNDK